MWWDEGEDEGVEQEQPVPAGHQPVPVRPPLRIFLAS